MEAEVSATLEAWTCVFLHDVLDVDAHLVHGAGDSSIAEEALDADLGNSSARRRLDLNQPRPVRRNRGWFEQVPANHGHAKEGIAEGVALGTRHDFTVRSPSATDMETLAISFK